MMHYMYVHVLNILQYQRFERNLTATVLRSLEITNFVDMVSPLVPDPPMNDGPRTIVD